MKSVFSILCLLRCFWEILLCWHFSSSVNICGTHRADFFVLFRFSVRIWYALKEIPISYDTSSIRLCAGLPRLVFVLYLLQFALWMSVDVQNVAYLQLRPSDYLEMFLPSTLLLKCQGNVLHRQLGQSLNINCSPIEQNVEFDHCSYLLFVK